MISALLGWGKLVGLIADGFHALAAALHDHQVAVNQKAKDINDARTKSDERVAQGLDARNDSSLGVRVDETRYRD